MIRLTANVPKGAPPAKFHSMFPAVHMNTRILDNPNSTAHKNMVVHTSKAQAGEQPHESVCTNSACSYIMLMFYKPTPLDPWMNRLVAWLDEPFSHVEIGFHDGYASSIFAGEERKICKKLS
jgi:hypothetical protein